MFEAIQHFFELNLVLVYFGYGLVFFVLGLAIVLQSRRRSHMELARSLGWLAAFGLGHGFYEWGIVFIPNQLVYLSQAGVQFLYSLHSLLLVLSFGFLFQFGVEMLRLRWPRLVFVPMAVMVVWGLLFFMPGFILMADFVQWHQQSIIWARYLIGFPAGLIAAIALRFQAEKTILPLEMKHIYNTLRIAGFTLVAYAVLAGLVVPAGNFFPANWLNETSLMTWLGIPVPIFRSMTGLVLAVTMIRALEVFDLEVDRLIQGMEVERSTALERERIGRELHDSTIQTIYTAGLLIESVRQKLPHEDKNALRLERSMHVLDEAIAGLRTYIEDLSPAPVQQTLENAIRTAATDPRWTSLIDVRLELGLPPAGTLSAQRLQQVLAILNEALSNTIRHAEARQVTISAKQAGCNLSLTVADDGRGFQEGQNGKGYGLRNMRDRARLLGGALAIESLPEQGVRVELVAPWEVDE